MAGPLTIRRSILLVLVAHLGLAPTEIHGADRIVIGGAPGTLAWDSQYSAVSVIDFASNVGQIQPTQVGENDNISLGILGRGGGITSPNARVVLEVSAGALEAQLANMISGDTTKAFEIKGISATGIIVEIDLGERLGVNRIRFFPRRGYEEFYLRGYELSLNDGSAEQMTLAGTPDFRVFKRVERNLQTVVDLDIPLQFVRYINLRQLVRGEWEIDEFQIFGRGFASSASYTSRVFDQGQPAVFGGIAWAEGSIGERTKTRVTLSTRSGSTPNLSDSVSWSPWSPPYPSGVLTDIVSPAPRRYLQFRFDFGTSDILSAATVDSVAFEVSPAIADSVKGEIWPQAALIGQDTPFAYTVRAINSSGFDHLEVETLAPVDVVRSVQIDGTEVPWEKEDTPQGVQIGFPAIRGDRVLRVIFDSVALQFNTVFSGRVFDSRRPQLLPQTILEGDVASDSLASGRDLSVTIIVGSNIIHSLAVTPLPFTPNQDGTNDTALIVYDIVNLTGGAHLSVNVHDLSGRLRRELYSGLDGSGRYLRPWDGKDGDGRRLPPGIYLVKLEISADSGKESRTVAVPLVY